MDFYDILFAKKLNGGGGGGGGWTADDVGIATYPNNLDVVYQGQYLQYYAFACSNIKTFTGANCTSLLQSYDPTGGGDSSTYVFAGSTVEEINLPNFNTRTGDCFAKNCKKLVKASLPKTIYVGSRSFEGCILLPLLVSQSATIIYSYSFSGATSLKTVDFLGGDTSSGIGQHAFDNCSVFDTLIIRATGNVTKLGTTNAFTNTPFASGGTGGTIYVPDAMISSYQSATNWSTILGYTNNQIKKIEGTIYETKYADGTPIGG